METRRIETIKKSPFVYLKAIFARILGKGSETYPNFHKYLTFGLNSWTLNITRSALMSLKPDHISCLKKYSGKSVDNIPTLLQTTNLYST